MSKDSLIKKITSVCMATVILVSGAMTVSAEGSEFANVDKIYSRDGSETIYISEDKFLYNFKGENPGVSICGYVGDSVDLDIPHLINGRDVSAIYEDSFADDERIVSVSFPNSVKVLGNNCFNGCKNLKKIELRTGIQVFDNVFCDCPRLESVTFPQGVHSIQNSFRNCESLNYVSLARSVTSVGDHSFTGCTSLKKIDWLGGIVKIGNAFDGCTSLESVTVPEGVVVIDGAFDNCTALKEITFPQSLLYITGGFTQCSSLTEVNLPDKLLFVNESFNGCENLSKLKYNASTTISDTAFLKCPKLVLEKEDNSFLRLLGWGLLVFIMAAAGFLTFRLLTYMSGNITRKVRQENAALEERDR